MRKPEKVNRRAWSMEERAEYDQMIREIIGETTNTHDRLDLFEARLNDAIQAQRFWARDVERTSIRNGLAAEVKAYQDRNRAMVSYEGELISLPAIQGTKTISASGEVYHQRELIELRPFKEIKEKRSETLRLMKVYNARVAHYDMLIALQDMCPEAATPAEAIETLNLDLPTYLRGAA